MKGSFSTSDLKDAIVFGVIGISVLCIFVVISFQATGELDHNVGYSDCLLPIGVISLIAAFSRMLGAITGTSDDIGSSTTFYCPYCKGKIRTNNIPIEGSSFTCPHCKNTIFK